MHTLVIEAVPPTALFTLPITLEILLAVVGQHVMLTRHKVDLFGGCSLQCLVKRIEFTRLRELTQIAGMNDEIRFVGHRVDFIDRCLQSSGDVRVSRLVETDVTVADLDKAEVPTFAGIPAVAFGECPRYRDATAHGPDQPGPRPRHTLQEPAAVDAIVVEILQLLIDKILLFVWHLPSVVCSVLG